MRRKLLATAILIGLLVAAGSALWMGRALRRVAATPPPAVTVLVNGAEELTASAGTPLVFTVYLSGGGEATPLSVGTNSQPWPELLRLEPADTAEPLPWTVVPLGPGQSVRLRETAGGGFEPVSAQGETATLDGGWLHSYELTVVPAATVPPGRHAVRGALEVPWWPPWRWHGRVASAPVVATILPASADADTALHSQRLVETAELQLRTGAFDDALATARELLSRAPDSVTAHVLAGDALAALARDPEALEAYDAALLLFARRDGEMEPADAILARKTRVVERLAAEER